MMFAKDFSEHKLPFCVRCQSWGMASEERRKPIRGGLTATSLLPTSSLTMPQDFSISGRHVVRHIQHTRYVLGVIALLCLMFFSRVGVADDVLPIEPVNLQLKWQHQFQFAGYYAAKAKGFYQQAGLDVTIIESQPGIDPIHEVVAGRAQFGVGTSELLLNRYRGDPVVVLGVIFQHSPLSLGL